MQVHSLSNPALVFLLITVAFAFMLISLGGCVSGRQTMPDVFGDVGERVTEVKKQKENQARQYQAALVPVVNLNIATVHETQSREANAYLGQSSYNPSPKAEFTGGDGVTYVCDVLNGQYENCMPKDTAASTQTMQMQTQPAQTAIGQSSASKAEFTGGDGIVYVCDVLNGQYENCMPKPSADANSRVTDAGKSSSQKAEFTSGDGVIYVCDVINGEYENCMPKTANAAPPPQPPAPATLAVAPTTSNKAEIIDDKGNAYQCDLIQGQYKNCVLTKKPDKIEYKNEKDERGNQYKCKYINGVKADCELTKKAKPKVEYKTETDERGNQYKCKYTDGEKGECTLTKKAKVKFEKMKDPDGNEYKCEVWNGNYENCVLTKAAPKKFVNIKDGNGVEYKCEEYRGQFINCEPVTNKSKHRSNKKK